MESEQSGSKSTYTTDLETVIASERTYIDARRDALNLPATDDEENRTWGLAISGGGIRSATIGLGIMQALIKKGVFRRFDYLSTVSGGGYIGSCLSSLLSRNAEAGVDKEDSPFVDLNRDAGKEAVSAGEVKLSARHQIHHLRSRGEFIAPAKGVLTRDVQRAVGAIYSGIVHHFLLFALLLCALVSGVHFLISFLDPAQPKLDPAADSGRLLLRTAWLPLTSEATGLDYVWEIVRQWWQTRIVATAESAFSLEGGAVPLLIAFLIGAAWSAIFVFRASQMSDGFNPKFPPPDENTRSGKSRQDDLEFRFTALFNTGSVLLAILVTFFVALSAGDQHTRAPYGYFAPLAFALGGQAIATAYIHPLQSFWPSNIARRSLFLTIEGAKVYGVIAAAAFPFGLLLLLSLSGLPVFKLLVAGAALFAGRKALANAPSEKNDEPSAIERFVKKPLRLTVVPLALAFGFSGVSEILLGLYGESFAFGKFWLSPLLVMVGSAALIAVLGTIIDSNRLSPHYFYRDRLTEAYLRTTAHVKRPGAAQQGMPLAVIRDDEDLKLSELGEDNGKGPYHLVVTALNLNGSEELVRKTMLSDHFIFSKNYVGSRVTGYVGTKEYRDGETKLARAMTISAAAAGSGAGLYTTLTSAFLATLFNVRLGYWMENPWYYRDGETQPERASTFWPAYLFREMTGGIDARGRLVNLSDGGHTGDNLALVPLLVRRCRLITVVDSESDLDYEFGSFNNAVRMAFIEEGIRIKIPELEEIAEPVGGSSTLGERKSRKSVAVGTIEYPDGSEGTLVYIKSSLPKALPVDVANYAKTHDTFPHETTADQFFDDAQFESYRALGDTLGTIAGDALVEFRNTHERTAPRPKPAAKTVGKTVKTKTLIPQPAAGRTVRKKKVARKVAKKTTKKKTKRRRARR